MNDDTSFPPPADQPDQPGGEQGVEHTTPLPFQPQLDDPGHTGPVFANPYVPGAPTGAGYPPPPPYTGSFGPTPSSTGVVDRPVGRGRRGFAAGVIAAALVVGGGAGVAGAAVYSSAHDGGSGSGFTGSSSTSQVVDETTSPAADGSVEGVAQKVLPSVVKLDVSGSQESGSGSGIILSSDGLILTNNHVAAVAANGGKITASFNDGSHATATIVGTDPLTDTALVQAQGVSGLTPATIGKSSALKVGEPVVAIGSPFGLDATVTSGIVSALERPVDVGSDGNGNTTTYPAIQTDAAINPGNSGGPLVDMNGNVVGIDASIQSTASSSSSQSGSIGLGFAIPIDEVLPVIDQMKNGQTPTHAKLGVSVQDATDTTGAQITDGATIQNVNNGSAAKAAGLQNGDVVTKIDDHQITSADSLVATIRSYRPGDQVTVTYERGGQQKTTQLTLDSDAGSSNS